MQVRCSSLPRVFKCHASVNVAFFDESEVAIESEHQMRRVGNMCHNRMAEYINNGVDAFAGLRNDCGLHSVDNERDAAFMIAESVKYIDSILPKLTDVRAEVTMEMIFDGINLSGTCDVRGKSVDNPSTGLIIDWKYGRIDRDHTAQLLGYSALWMQEDDAIEEVYAHVFEPRFFKVEKYRFTREDVGRFLKELSDIVHEDNKAYTPSFEACEYCRNYDNCEAKKKWITTGYTDLMVLGNTEIGKIDPAKIASIDSQVRLLKKAIDAYDAALKATIMEHGPQDVGNEIISIEDSPRYQIHYDRNALMKWIDPEQMHLLTPTVSKSDLDAAVSASTPKGETKGKRRRDALEALIDNGTIVRNMTKRITRKQKAKEIE